MKNILVLHSSAMVRQWIIGICGDSGRYGSVLSAPDFEIAVRKFEGFLQNVLLIEDRLLDHRTRAWIVDRRHRCDEHLLILHSESREQGHYRSFVLDKHHHREDLETYRSALLEKIDELASNRFYEDIPAPRDNVPRVQPYLPHEEKIHPDSLMPYLDHVDRSQTSRVVVLGASTGGTEAIYRVLKDLAPDQPPLVMVQHMPKGFIPGFAESLHRRSGRTVQIARDHQVLDTGDICLIPGGVQGAVRCSSEDRVVIDLLEEPAISRHQPSVNILFRSAAMWFGPRTTAILLTGMGDDGVIGMGEIKANGGECIIQDEESAVVFGMPGEAKRLGFAEREMTLDEISRHVSQIPSNGS